MDDENGFNPDADYEARMTREYARRARGRAKGQQLAARLEHTAGRVALAQIELARRELDMREALIRSRPTEPESNGIDDGPVVFFRKTFGGGGDPAVVGGFQYVAIRVPDWRTGWYLTGPRSPRESLSWEELLAFAAKDETELPEIWLASEYRRVEPADGQ